MKFAMNGCLIIGTLDGANVEITREIGIDNIFIFGARAEQISALRAQVKEQTHDADSRFTETLDFLENGDLVDPAVVEPILNSLRGGNDYYLLSVDFPACKTCL